jgi:hypothetical protein
MSSPRNDYVVAVLLNQTLFPFVEPVLLTLPSSSISIVQGYWRQYRRVIRRVVDLYAS